MNGGEGESLKRSRNRQALVFLGISLSFYWIFLRRSYFGILFSGHTSLRPDSQTYYLVYLVAMAIIGLISIAAHRQWEALIKKHRHVVPLVSVAAAVSGATIYIAPFAGILGMITSAICTTALSFNFVLLTYALGISAATIVMPGKDGKSVPLSIILSFVASYAVSFLLLTPAPLPALLVIFAPLVSGGFWVLLPQPTREEKPNSKKREATQGRVGKLPMRLIVTLVFFLLIGGFMRGLTYSGDISYIPQKDSVFPHIVSVVFALMIFFMLLFSKQQKRFLYSIWIILATLFFAGLFAVSLFNNEWPAASTAILISGRTCLNFFLWLLLVNAIRETGQSTVMTLGIFFVMTEVASALLSYLVIPNALPHLAAVSKNYMAFLSMGMALMLIITSLIMLASEAFRNDGAENHSSPSAESGHENSGATPAAIASSEDDWRRACNAIAAEYALTKRETEVMLLISRGNSIGKVAQSLFVTEGTVKTHTKSIYRKLGIHSKQDLIDLVAHRTII